MPKALVCINTDINSDYFAAEEVVTELRMCAGVEEAFRVHGVYDVIAKVSAETTEGLLEIVTIYIKRLRNVQTAHTMLIVEPEASMNEKRILLV
jgi:DNA-binding Lrp family transcriptional regulator